MILQVETDDDKTVDPTPAPHRFGLLQAVLVVRADSAHSIGLRGGGRRAVDRAEAVYPGTGFGKRSADRRSRTERSGQAPGCVPGRTADRVQVLEVPNGAGPRFRNRNPECLRPAHPSRTRPRSPFLHLQRLPSIGRGRGSVECVPRIADVPGFVVTRRTVCVEGICARCVEASAASARTSNCTHGEAVSGWPVAADGPERSQVAGRAGMRMRHKALICLLPLGAGPRSVRAASNATALRSAFFRATSAPEGP